MGRGGNPFRISPRGFRRQGSRRTNRRGGDRGSPLLNVSAWSPLHRAGFGTAALLLYGVLMLPLILSGPESMVAMIGFFITFLPGMVFSLVACELGPTMDLCSMLPAILAFGAYCGNCLVLLGPLGSCIENLDKPLVYNVSVCDAQAWAGAGGVYFRDGSLQQAGGVNHLAFQVNAQGCTNGKFPQACTLHLAPVFPNAGSTSVCAVAVREGSPPAPTGCDSEASTELCGRETDFELLLGVSCGAFNTGETSCSRGDESILQAIREQGYSADTPVLELGSPEEFRSSCTVWIVLCVIFSILFVPVHALWLCLQDLPELVSNGMLPFFGLGRDASSEGNVPVGAPVGGSCPLGKDATLFSVGCTDGSSAATAAI